MTRWCWSSAGRPWRRWPTEAVDRGIGARGLRAVLEEVMTKIMYERPL